MDANYSKILKKKEKTPLPLRDLRGGIISEKNDIDEEDDGPLDILVNFVA